MASPHLTFQNARFIMIVRSRKLRRLDDGYKARFGGWIQVACRTCPSSSAALFPLESAPQGGFPIAPAAKSIGHVCVNPERENPRSGVVLKGRGVTFWSQRVGRTEGCPGARRGFDEAGTGVELVDGMPRQHGLRTHAVTSGKPCKRRRSHDLCAMRPTDRMTGHAKTAYVALRRNVGGLLGESPSLWESGAGK